MTTPTKTTGQPSSRTNLIKYIVKESRETDLLDLGNQEKATKALDIVLAGMKQILQTEKPLVFLGFGTFSVQNVPAREGRNPRTGDKIEIPAHKSLRFKAGKDMREALNPADKTAKKAAAKKK